MGKSHKDDVMKKLIAFTALLLICFAANSALASEMPVDFRNGQQVVVSEIDHVPTALRYKGGSIVIHKGMAGDTFTGYTFLRVGNHRRVGCIFDDKVVVLTKLYEMTVDDVSVPGGENATFNNCHAVKIKLI